MLLLVGTGPLLEVLPALGLRHLAHAPVLDFRQFVYTPGRAAHKIQAT
jgi:hypothetical protein